MIRTCNCHSDLLSDNTHWRNKNTRDYFIFQNPSRTIDLKFCIWGQCNWVTCRLFRGDLTHWLQGLNSLEMTCAGSSISTVNVNSGRKHSYRVLWSVMQSCSWSPTGVWTFLVPLNPKKCPKLTSVHIFFTLVTLHDQRIETSIHFWFNVCIFPKYLG